MQVELPGELRTPTPFQLRKLQNLVRTLEAENTELRKHIGADEGASVIIEKLKRELTEARLKADEALLELRLLKESSKERRKV